MTAKHNDDFAIKWTDGLTKREYFAALALQGLLANPNNTITRIQAFEAVKAADALIAALEMPPKK
ncbi:hypothetical protein JYQ62_02165 [Nostoc sp. UHCC 0702]|nr:hypothetical protein JYQ62_02165 [Nostoc sp. UHCC 0702]